MERYTARLQRFDDDIVEVACGDSRAEIVAAAQAIYTALVADVLAEGRSFLIHPQRHQDEDLIHGRMEDRLRAMEYGIGVYDRGPSARDARLNDPVRPTAELVFWLGATRETRGAVMDRAVNTVVLTFETTVDVAVNLETGEWKIEHGAMGELAEDAHYATLWCEGEWAGDVQLPYEVDMLDDPDKEALELAIAIVNGEVGGRVLP